ncbi:hypothetical protein CGRA01v4_02418 [Colletotrichum graminicola]|nr:hypothetical protein CGRA01v4_02418 [Colletotrichum graminicola]
MSVTSRCSWLVPSFPAPSSSRKEGLALAWVPFSIKVSCTGRPYSLDAISECFYRLAAACTAAITSFRFPVQTAHTHTHTHTHTRTHS